MAVAKDNWLKKRVGTFTESGGSPSVVDLTKHNLGFDPEGVYTRLRFQVDIAVGNNVDIYVRGPLGQWSRVVTGMADLATAEVVGPWPAYRVVFNGPGAGRTVSVTAYAQTGGW